MNNRGSKLNIDGFVFGQERVARVQKDEKQSTDVVVLMHGLVKKENFSIHKVGCKDTMREARAMMSQPGGRFANTKLAIESCIDEDSCKMGWGEVDWDEQIKVHNCAKDASYKENVNKDPIILVSRDPNY